MLNRNKPSSDTAADTNPEEELQPGCCLRDSMLFPTPLDQSWQAGCWRVSFPLGYKNLLRIMGEKKGKSYRKTLQK